MRKLISNSKIMCGIFRAIVLEAWNTEASLYIPALHRTQMPFAIDESGTITGLANGESLDALDHTSSVSTPISIDSSSLPDSSEEDEENADGEDTDNDQEDDDTENPDQDEEDDENNPETRDTEPEDEDETGNEGDNTEEETDEEEANEEESDSSATVNPSEPIILTDNAGNKLAMQLKDFPKAQLSCWIGRSTVKPGMPLWIAFENEDSEFPIILGTLGSTLEYGELGSLLGGGGSTMALSAVGFNGEYYEGLPTYSLSEDQITYVATWVTGECGGEDIIACKKIASQMANLSEFQNNDRADYDTLKATLDSGWYDPKSFTLGCTETAKSAVKECLVDGKRVLPRYVVEFCTFAPQYIATYKEAESWNKGDPVVQTFGGGGTFYFVCFDKTDLSDYDLNIMGYTEASYEKYKDDDNRKASGMPYSSSEVVNAMFTEGLRIINKGVPYVYGGNSDSGYDCSAFVSKCLNAAGFNVGRLTTDSLITSLPQIGWQEITSSVNRSTGEGLLPGDIGVSSSHTEIFYSNNPLQEMGAHNSNAGITIRDYSTWFWPEARVYRHNGS